jgi:DNA-binding transcriptional LysR family regulator
MDFDIRAFVRVVERGSFSAAAADVGLTPSAMSKLVTRLEGRLGVRLLYRTTRRLALTAEGETFHRRACDILEAIKDAEAEVAQAGQPRGRLRINCVTGFAFHELSGVVPSFIARYPDVSIELVVTDRVIDLLAENTDIGIRSGTINDPSLVARKIADFERCLYAAPDYLAQRGTPIMPSDLVDHDCIVHASKPPYHWPFRIDGRVATVDIRSRLVVDNAETALRIAMAGGGVTRIADVLVGEAVRNGRLVPVLADFHASEPIPLSAVYPQGRHRIPRVRVFLDFLVDRFSQVPWRHDVPPRRSAQMVEENGVRLLSSTQAFEPAASAEGE